MDAKHITTNTQLQLGANHFEQLQIMKTVWRGKQPDLARHNTEVMEEIELVDANERLIDDQLAEEWDAALGQGSDEEYQA